MGKAQLLAEPSNGKPFIIHMSIRPFRTRVERKTDGRFGLSESKAVYTLQLESARRHEAQLSPFQPCL